MPKQKPIQITIPNPCQQKWEEMTPDAGGRFCAHCQKTVIDFTEWSDEALYRFLSINNQSICGSVRRSQLGRPLALPTSPQSRLHRVLVAAGLTMLFAQGAPLQAHPKPPLQYIIPDEKVSGEDTTTSAGSEGSLSGVVLYHDLQPFSSCSVVLSQNENTVATTLTDSNGFFLISNISSGNYTLLLTYRESARLQIDVTVSGTTQIKNPLFLESTILGNFKCIPIKENTKHRRKKKRS